MKNARTNYVPANRSYLIILIILLSLGTACKKMETSKTPAIPQSLETSSQAYFNQLLSNEAALMASLKETDAARNTGVKPHLQKKQIRVTQTARFHDMALKIDWNSVEKYKIDKVNYLVVPVKENIKPFNNKSFEFFRKLVFYNPAGGEVKMTVLEVLGNKNASLGSDLSSITRTALENRFGNKSDAIGNLNASVLFFNNNYGRDTSYSLTDGRWASARISFRSDLDIKF
jgi:hypothetical protein